MSQKENVLKSYYNDKNNIGMSTVYTPKEVRDKMTVYAEVGMRILVLFNFEFCVDLFEIGYKDVTFASDDNLRNEIVKEKFNYNVELIDPRDINKKFKGMRFDLIISNPPYNNGLDLNILYNIKDLSNKICFVHPMTWLYDNKENRRYMKIKNGLKDQFVSVFPINSSETFGISVIIDCGITFFDKNTLVKGDIFSYDLHGNEDFYLNIKNKILNFCKYYNLHDNLSLKNIKPFEVGFNALRGHGKYDLYTFLENRDQTKHLSKGFTPFSMKFGFDTEKDAINFKNYLKLKFTRFCLSILKINRHVDNGELKSVPWLDFSKSWTDEQCANELGITNEELLWMINWIPNYYVEDEELYEKLEKKLEK